VPCLRLTQTVGSFSDAFPGTVTLKKFPNRCSGAQFMRVPDLRPVIFAQMREFWPDTEAKLGICNGACGGNVVQQAISDFGRFCFDGRE
jgi:hypothetical protein